MCGDFGKLVDPRMIILHDDISYIYQTDLWYSLGMLFDLQSSLIIHGRSISLTMAQ
jgi:hypothetical protein